VSWDRGPVAKAIAAAVETAATAQSVEVSVFEKPPFTLNVPAIVVGRPSQVRYSVAGFSIDDVELPVLCVHGPDQDDAVSDLIALVRSSLTDQTLGGVVQLCIATGERYWRNLKVAGADVLAAELVLTVNM
jgi:hypothetical protein